MKTANQASKDELKNEILTEFKQVYKLAPADLLTKLEVEL